jgi:hypothetical protein
MTNISSRTPRPPTLKSCSRLFSLHFRRFTAFKRVTAPIINARINHSTIFFRKVAVETHNGNEFQSQSHHGNVCLLSLVGVRLSLLGMSATIWPIVQSRMIDGDVWGAVGRLKIGSRTEVLGATLSITNPTWPNLCWNPCRHGLSAWYMVRTFKILLINRKLLLLDNKTNWNSLFHHHVLYPTQSCTCTIITLYVQC